MRKFLLGDIHGRHKALVQVLDRCGFNKEEDLLIFLGDVYDRGDEPFLCIDELLQIRHRVFIRGNHDHNFWSFTQTGHDGFGGHNGVMVTKLKWREADEETRQFALRFMSEQVPYFVDDKNRLFTHGGFDREKPVINQMEDVFAWDRELWQQAMSCKGDQKLKTADGFEKIYIGHTPTLLWNRDTPMYSGGVFNLDTGAGFGSGRLTIMDIETEQFWQSDIIDELEAVKENI
jgi:serine/threonine protein phosphatase 1